MPISLPGTDSVVSGAFEPLLDMGRGRNSVSRVTRSSAERHPFRGELDAGVAIDPGKRDELSRVTNSSMLALRSIEENVMNYRGHQQRIQYMILITTGGLSDLKLRAKYSLYLWR